MRFFLRIIGFLLLLPFVLIGLVLGALQFQPVRDQVVALVNSNVATPDFGVQLTGFRGAPPFDVHLDELRLRDSEGEWLSLEEFQLTIAWRKLFGLRAEIDELSAASLTVTRAPVSTAPPVEEPAGEMTLPPPPQLPTSLPPIALNKLAVERIELGEALIGQAVTLGVHGHARVNDAADQLDVALDIKRLDQETAQVSLKAALDLVEEILAIDLGAEETGGLLAELSGIPEAGDLHASLKGQGPLSDWNGQLELDAHNLATLESDLALRYTDSLGVGLNATMQPEAAILPDTIASLTGRSIDLDLDATYRDPGVLTLAKLDVRTAGPTLSASGEVDLDQQTHSLRASASLAELSQAATLANADLAGEATLDLRSEGSLLQPKAHLTIDGKRIVFNDLSLETLSLAAAVDVTAPLDQDNAAGSLDLNGSVVGLAQGDRSLLVEDRLDLSGAATLSDKTRIALENLRLVMGDVAITTSGTFDYQALEGDAELSLDVPDLQPVIATYAGSPPPLDLTGALELDVPVTITSELQEIRVHPVLTTRDLAGLPPGAAELLGTSPRLEIQAKFVDQKAVTLETMRLDAADLALAASGTANIETQSMDVQLISEIPRLAALSGAAGMDLEGSLKLEADAQGSFTEPNANVLLSVADLRAAGQAIDELAFRLSQRGTIEAPNGTIGLTARFDTDNVSLESKYSLADQLFSLDDLIIKAPETKLTGLAAFDLGTQLASAEIKGAVDDLGALRRWHQQNLEGRLTVDATVTPDAGDQDAVVDLQLTGLAGDFGTLRQVIVQGTADTLKTEPDLNLNLDLTEFSAPGAVVRSAKATVAGPISEMLITLATRGAVRQSEFVIDTNAEIAVAPEGQTVTLSTLEGSFGSEQFSLAQTATARIAGQDISLDNLDLTFGDARLQAEVALDARQAQSNINLSNLDLTKLEQFGAPALQGSTNVTVTSEGSPTAPQIDVDATIKGFAPGTDDLGISTDLDASVRYAAERLQANLQAAGLSEQPLQAEVGLPMSIDLRPVAFALEETAPLTGSVTFDGELRRIAEILVLEDQILRGPIDIDLVLKGTVAAPLIDGQASIKNGYVADSLSGVELRNTNLVIEAADNRLEITELSANDSGKGRLSGTGFVDLRPAADETFDAKLSVDQFRAMENEFGTTLLSGTLDAGGTFQNLSVEGDLTLGPAELRLPNPSGTSVNTLDVTEVYAAGEEPVETAEPSAPMRIALDIAVDMPNQIFIRGRGLDTEWGGNLSITGDSSAPIIEGTIDYRRGFLDLLGERFQITEGQITFDGGNPPIPEINLTAQADAEEITAIVRISGRATDPQIELTSEPELPQDEVISRLFFGTDTSSLTPAQGIRLAIAVDTLRGGGPDMLGELRSLVGLDTLSVSGDDQDSAAVTAGEYITDRVYLEVQRGATENSGKARVEIELTPRLSVDTEVTEDAQTGVGFNWTYDY